MDPDGVPRPLTPVFEALVPLPERSTRLAADRPGRQGEDHDGAADAGSRLYRYLAQTFNFEL